MALTDYSKTCGKHTPGNKQLILIEADQVTSITLATGEVDNVVLTAADDAVDVSFDLDGMKRTEEASGTKNGGYTVTQKLEVHLSKASSSLRTFLENTAAHSNCGIVPLVKDNNGTWWMMGIEETSSTAATASRGMYVESCNFDSGLAQTDEEGDKYILTLSGTFADHAFPVDSDSTVDSSSATVVDDGVV